MVVVALREGAAAHGLSTDFWTLRRPLIVEFLKALAKHIGNRADRNSGQCNEQPACTALHSGHTAGETVPPQILPPLQIRQRLLRSLTGSGNTQGATGTTVNSLRA